MERLECGSLGTWQAAGMLGLTDRQVRRIRIRYKEAGMASLVHGNHGRAPVNRTPPGMAERLAALFGEGGVYEDYDIAHARDELERNEHIMVSRSTLSRMLWRQGLRTANAERRRAHRSRRARMRAQGDLVQIDGSPHDWLEARGPRMCLIGGIDDATGWIVSALFRPTEDQVGYLLLMRQMALTYGLPMAFYHDGHTLFRSPKQATIDDELAGRQPESQIQRVMRELGVESIKAGSPEAKGRIERLWGTLQNRLIREMRRAGVSDIEAANDYLPEFVQRHNQRFGVEPADASSAWVALDSSTDLDYYFATREHRVVRRDHTVAWYGDTLQLLPAPHDRPLVGTKVQVHVTPEDQVVLYDGDKLRLPYRHVQHDAPTPQPVRGLVSLKALLPTADAHQAKRKQLRWVFAGSHGELKYPAALRKQGKESDPCE